MTHGSRGLAAFAAGWGLIVAAINFVPSPNLNSTVAVLLAVSIGSCIAAAVLAMRGHRRAAGAFLVVAGLAGPTGYGYLINIVAIAVGLAEVATRRTANAAPAHT